MARSNLRARPLLQSSNHPNKTTGDRKATPAPAVLRVKVVGFKPHPNPYEDDHSAQYSFKLLANLELEQSIAGKRAVSTNTESDHNERRRVQVREFLNHWMQVNPREQKLDGPVMRDLERTWTESPKEFFRVNRGLVLSADAVSYNNETGLAEIHLTNPKKHGVVDGGHTLRKLLEELIPSTYADADDAADEEDDDIDDQNENDGEEEIQEAEPDRYVSCEVWTGLTLEQVALLSQGRNTSRTVPPYGIMAIKGDFDSLEQAISQKNSDYAKKIAFKPNQHIEGLEDFRPINVLEIIQLLMAMDITRSGADNHPIDAYKNRSLAQPFFAHPLPNEEGSRSRRAEYEEMYPLIGDFLGLYDKLREKVPEAYDTAKSRPRKCPRFWTKVLAGKGKKVRSATNKKVEPLYYIDPTGGHRVFSSPTSLFFPMFSAFRAYLKKEGGRYAWDGLSPLKWPENEFLQVCQRLAIKIASAARDRSSLHDVGRDEQVWATCYETLNSDLLANGRKKMVG